MFPEALADYDYCVNKLFDKDIININPEKIRQIRKYINKIIKYVQ